jgi:uncharacterized membrane protein
MRDRPGLGERSWSMSVLVLGVFPGEESAVLVLRDLRADRASAAGFPSAATVRVGAAGSYSLETTARPGSGRGFSGMFWEALFGLIFLLPVPGSSYGPGAGALFGTLVDAGVDEGFLARARTALPPGTSALGVILEAEDPWEVLGELLSHGGTLIWKALTPEQDAELERELGGSP